MSSADSVSQNTQDFFNSYRVSVATGVSLAATGNAVVTLPILSGGLTQTTGAFILRNITVSNPANIAGGAVPNMAAANVTILTSNDGNTSNAVTTAVGQTLTNVTAVNTWQDLTLAAGMATSTVTSSALFLKVNASVANASVMIGVYGTVVQF